MSVTFDNLLQCPVTGEALEVLSDQALAQLNAQIHKGNMVQGHAVVYTTVLQQAIGNAARTVFYPVIDGIICLLAHLQITQGALTLKAEALAHTKQQVQQFYDDAGWKMNPEGIFQDALDSEDLRSVSHPYIQKCHARLQRFLKPSGRYLLDVASGPIQYPEYLEYSKGFQYRICADLSLTALRQAQRKLKDKGIYVLCDVTQLPFCSNSIDCVISLHTLYHVPANEQLLALRELQRVQHPKGTLLIVYSWGAHSLLMKGALGGAKCIRRLWRMCQLKQSPQQTLYFFAHNYRWFEKYLRPKGFRCVPWRSVNVPFLKVFIHRWLLGRAFLSLLFWAENRFPVFFGRFGAYPMFILQKNVEHG